MVACVALQEAEYLYLNKHHALMTGKRALYRRKPCTKTPCSVLCLVGIYNNRKSEFFEPVTFEELLQNNNRWYGRENVEE